MERLKKGTFKTLTPEQQKAHIHELVKQWRQRNQEKVKKTNSYFAKKYRETKPWKSVCKFCGATFPSHRENSNKICPECMAELKHRVEMRKKAIILRRDARKTINAMVLALRQAGCKQKEIAEKLNISQSGVSQILIRKHGIRKVAKVKRNRK